MELNFDQFIDFFNSSTFDLVKIGLLAYIAILWISIIIWIARDSISRSSSLFFQTVSILLGFIPFLGVLVYLILRPSKTTAELYYEELEHRLMSETPESNDNVCEKCMANLAQDFLFCPNCGEQAKHTCEKCKKHFPHFYSICPYCGVKQKGVKSKTSPKKKRKSKKVIKEIDEEETNDQKLGEEEGLEEKEE